MIKIDDIKSLSLIMLLMGCSSLSKKFDYTTEENFVFQNSPKLIFDIYKPTAIAKAPVVLVIHGGGWSSRSGDMSSICEQLAEQGYLALNVTYRLAPKNIYPTALDDVKAALSYVREHSTELNANPDRIFVWGYSAGAHLALLLGLNPDNKIKAIVSGAAPTNLVAYPRSSMISKFMGGNYDKVPQLWEEASPINQIKENSPPVFLYHGKADLLVGIEQMRLMQKKLEEKKVPVVTKEVSLLGHVGVYLLSQDSIDEGIEFINSYNK